MAENKSVVQTTQEVIQSTLDIWAILPKELTIYLLIIFTISVLLQWVKKSFLMKRQKKDKLRILWNVSFPIGIALSGLGYYVTEKFIAVGYWVIIALTASTASMGLFAVTTNYVWPLLKVILKAVGDRAYIVVTGKPRDDV